eukprot:m.83695 g.83695  ORF g.83695 m.83695 type:complete len:425 (+) comp12131_c0_seq2:192-1466(+)
MLLTVKNCSLLFAAAVLVVCGVCVQGGDIDMNSPVPLPYNFLMHSRASNEGFHSTLAAQSQQGTFSVSKFETPVGTATAINFEETSSVEVYDVGEAVALSLYVVTHFRPSSVPQISVNSACPGLFQMHVNEEGRLVVTTCDGTSPVTHPTNVVVSDEGNGLTFIGVIGNEADKTITLFVNTTSATHRFSHTFSASKASTLTMTGEQDVVEIFWSNFQYNHQYINSLAVYYFALLNGGLVEAVPSEIFVNSNDPDRPLDTGSGDEEEIAGGDLLLVGCVDGISTSQEVCECPQDCRRCLLPLYEGSDASCVECSSPFILHLEECLSSCPVGFVETITGTASVCAFSTSTTAPNAQGSTGVESTTSVQVFMVIAIAICVICLIALVAVFISYKRAVSSNEHSLKFNSQKRQHHFDDSNSIDAASTL